MSSDASATDKVHTLSSFSKRTGERIAGSLAGCGIIWTTSAITATQATLSTLAFRPGPVEVCGMGVLLWLATKWRLCIMQQAVQSMYKEQSTASGKGSAAN